MSVKRTYGLLSKEERIVRAVFNVEQLQTRFYIVSFIIALLLAVLYVDFIFYVV